MAITYVASTTGTPGDNLTSGDWTLPGGWAAGDVAIFWWFTWLKTKTFSPPGTVSVLQERADGTVSSGRIYIGYRVLQGGDTTFSWTASSVANSTVLFGVDVFSGVDTTTPADDEAIAEFVDSNDPDPPAVTPSVDDCAIWTLFVKNNDFTGTPTEPTNYTTAQTSSSFLGNDASAGTAYRILTGGSGVSQDPGAWTVAGGAANDDGWVYTLALTPAAGGGGFTGAARIIGGGWSSPLHGLVVR